MDVDVAVLGAGFGGLGMAIRLRQEGRHDFVVLEQADELGGTWRANSYPGCACDVPSQLYSYSFARNPGWTRRFSPQPEILRYLKTCAERFGVTGHLRLGTEVLDAAWDEDARRWRITTNRGPLTARVLVSAAGPLCEPAVPDLPGLATFAGRAFHSARWDHGYDLAGKRVAVVGTGASAIQFVPRIAPVVDSLHVFQRTPPWVMPRRDRAYTALERRAWRAVPALQQLARAGTYAVRETFLINFKHPRLSALFQRAALRHLRRSVPDAALRERLVPSYALGCKRVLISDDYLPALTRPNVELVTAGIARVEPDAVVTADGVRREVDAIIFGTGFHVTDMPIAERVRGRDGRTLAQVWQGSPQAHLGTTVAGFPNLFLVLGPNTGLGHNSVVLMIESQLRHVLSALRFLRERELVAVAPRPEVQAAFVAEVDARLATMVWNAGGCSSWYLDATGRNSTIWPGSTWAFRRRLARFRPDDYELLAARPVPKVPGRGRDASSEPAPSQAGVLP